MNELFSFSTNLIEANKNDNIQVYSKYTYQKNITLKIESNVERLNGFYVIQANDNKIMDFVLTENTKLKVINIWGGEFEENGVLECEINIVQNIVNNKDTNKKDKQHNKLYYQKKYTGEKAFLREHYTFKQSVDNVYYVDVLNVVDNIKISDNAKFKILRNNSSKNITIEFDKLKKLNVILSVTLDNNTYDINGQEILNENDIYLLIDQIYKTFKYNNINDIKLEYKNLKLHILDQKNSKYSRIKLNGPEISLSYVFNKNEIKTNKLKILHDSIKSNTIIINAPNAYSNNKCVINIIKNSHNKFELDYYINDDICFVTLQTNTPLNHDLDWVLTTTDKQYFSHNTLKKDSNKLMWIFNISNFKHDFMLICNSLNNQTLYKKVILPIYTSDSIYYNVTHNKSTTILNIFSNKNISDSFNFNLNVLNNSISKENIDFKIKQTNFKILKNEKFKQIKIKWLTNKPIKDIKLKLNNIIIPIKKINLEYYPTNIMLNNDSTYKHTLDKIVNRELILKYKDGEISDTITLPTNSRHFTYHPLSCVVNWQIYDNDVLIFEQDIFYNKVVNEVKVLYDNIVKYSNNSYLIFEAPHVFNKNIKIKINSISNIGINISGKYEIDHKTGKLKIPVKTNRKHSIGWLIFRIYSLTDNVIINNKKHIIMFN